jgi:hypothetical protein
VLFEEYEKAAWGLRDGCHGCYVWKGARALFYAS